VAGRIRGVNVPGKFSETSPQIRHHAPGLGEHTIEVLREFGLSDSHISAMLDSKAAVQEPRQRAKAEL
jgi:crotonobetainyl-CoA:carnitine CoA-transferase CaiB-like acyl-CoA transferase